MGRSDPLFRGNNSTAHTGSTATSDPPITSRSFTIPQAASTIKYKPQLEEIVQEKEILETSIDPLEWKKECDRVHDQLKLNIKTMSVFETDAEEINARRKVMVDHLKVVREFAESNVPILIESMCQDWN